jgi:hypothetical protein
MSERPEIPKERYGQPVSTGGTREPLELLPEREWLNAKIIDVKYQVAMFNNQIQYVTYKDDNNEEVQVKDPEGNPIMREEFEFVFTMHDYKLPNDDQRKCWLKLGASFGEKAHLPQFLMKVLNNLDGITCPDSIISACKGKEVKLQLKNKLSKDGTKTYQNVVWDAVKCAIGAVEAPIQEPTPATEDPTIQPEDVAWTE